MERKNKFTRLVRGFQSAKLDNNGTIAVAVFLRRPLGSKKGGYATGNISRTLSVSDSQVSVVFAAIEKALFG
jgi:hypothetical protein